MATEKACARPILRTRAATATGPAPFPGEVGTVSAVGLESRFGFGSGFRMGQWHGALADVDGGAGRGGELAFAHARARG